MPRQTIAAQWPRSAIVVVAVCLALAFAAPAVRAACPLQNEAPMLIVTLYFGETIPNKPPLTAKQWADFTAKIITPAFPDGFTVSDGQGQWMDPRTKTIGHEATKILTVAAEDTPALGPKIDHVIAAYRQDFGQESVGITTTNACGTF